MSYDNNNEYEGELTVCVTLIAESSLLMATDLNPDDFIFPETRNIYQTLLSLSATSEPIDVITVATEMDNSGMGTGWLQRFGELSSMVSVKNFDSYAKHVKKMSQVRSVRGIAQNLLDNSESGTKAADEAIMELMGINNTKRNYDHSLQSALIAATNEIERQVAGGDILGVKTGIALIDKLFGGFHNSDLITIGARPAMGKTALMLNLAINADEPVGIISAEQGMAQMGSRIMSIGGMVSTSKIRSGNLGHDDYSKITQVGSKLMSRVIQLYDKPAPTLRDIVSQARKWRHTLGIKALYVDYLQRIKVDGTAARHEQIGDIAMGLKELARELDIPVIALAQVNRAVESRPNKRPQMGDLKDSGVIEQESDVIAMLYRDEVYTDDSEFKGIAEIDYKKNRHGETGLIRTSWRGEFLKFDDLSSQYQ